MPLVIRLEFTADNLANYALPPNEGRSDVRIVKPGQSVRSTYTEQQFLTAVDGLERVVRHGHITIRLVVEETPDVPNTMAFIRSTSSLVCEHLLKTIPSGVKTEMPPIQPAKEAWHSRPSGILVLGIIITVVGGIILAFIMGDCSKSYTSSNNRLQTIGAKAPQSEP